MKWIEPSVELMGLTPLYHKDNLHAALKHIELCGRKCYKSEDRITEDSATKFVGKLQSSGHLSVLEHSNMVVHLFPDKVILANLSPYIKRGVFSYRGGRQVVTLGGNIRAWLEYLAGYYFEPNILDPYHFEAAIERIDPYAEIITDPDKVPATLRRYTVSFIHDRAFTHELVRHRPASYSQESQRYVRYQDDIEFIMPIEYRGTTPPSWLDYSARVAELSYQHAIENGVLPQIARTVLPNCTKTEIAVTADLIEWQHIIKLRSSKAAHPDMQEIFGYYGPKIIEGIMGGKHHESATDDQQREAGGDTD